MEEIKQKGEEVTDEVVHTLHISLPFGHIPLSFKIIALLASAGGLSIVASGIADVVRTRSESNMEFLLFLISGLMMIAIGYGIIKKREWSLYLFILVLFLALIFNENAVAVALLTGVVVWLCDRREYFVSGKINFAELGRRWKNWVNKKSIEKIIVVDTEGDIISERLEDLDPEDEKKIQAKAK